MLSGASPLTLPEERGTFKQLLKETLRLPEGRVMSAPRPQTSAHRVPVSEPEAMPLSPTLKADVIELLAQAVVADLREHPNLPAELVNHTVAVVPRRGNARSGIAVVPTARRSRSKAAPDAVSEGR